MKAITEGLCGHRFSSSTISQINKGLAESLARFATRPLDEAYPDLILDARYEKVLEEAVIQSQAVRVAIGINREGQRQVLAVDTTDRESRSAWKGFLLRLKERGLSGVELVVSDVFRNQPGTVRQPFRLALAVGQTIQHAYNPDSRSANARLSETPIRIDADPAQQGMHATISQSQTKPRGHTVGHRRTKNNPGSGSEHGPE